MAKKANKGRVLKMYIISKVNKLIKKYKTVDPFELCEKIGIEVVFADIGKLKGMYTCIKRNRFVVINKKLDPYTRIVVCAHELAHDQLHRKLSNASWLKDVNMYDMNIKQEYEANLFVSELLIQEEKLISLINEGVTIDEISKRLCIDKNLIAMKVKRLISCGYDFIHQDFVSDFLKN